MEDLEDAPEEDLWLLPGPWQDEGDDLPPGPRAEPLDPALITPWASAEAAMAARLARVAGRLGALDDRLQRGPDGWRHRLALIEATELSWFVGDRIGMDRLSLWLSLRLSGVQDDASVLAHAGWAVRRLSSGPGPQGDLAAFLERHDSRNMLADAEPLADRAENWLELMGQAKGLHPISHACMGYHMWNLSGLGQRGGQMEAAVTALRIAASEGRGMIFAPLAMGGAEGLRPGGSVPDRLNRWLAGMEAGCLRAMRQLDDIEAWTARAKAQMARLSGKTPPALRAVIGEWPLVSAPIAEALTGASRAAVQRNLVWMEAQGLIREVTGQGRYRMWRAHV